MVSFLDGHSLPAGEANRHLAHIAENLRQSDRIEVEASSGLDPLEALQFSWAVSSHGWFIMDRAGEPVAVFGAAPMVAPGAGLVWMLGTDGIIREAVGIARATRPYVERMMADYALLWNHVDVRNYVSARWLQWAGFKLLSTAPHGRLGEPFHLFARSA